VRKSGGAGGKKQSRKEATEEEYRSGWDTKWNTQVGEEQGIGIGSRGRASRDQMKREERRKQKRGTLDTTGDKKNKKQENRSMGKLMSVPLNLGSTRQGEGVGANAKQRKEERLECDGGRKCTSRRRGAAKHERKWKWGHCQNQRTRPKHNLIAVHGGAFREKPRLFGDGMTDVAKKKRVKKSRLPQEKTQEAKEQGGGIR